MAPTGKEEGRREVLVDPITPTLSAVSSGSDLSTLGKGEVEEDKRITFMGSKDEAAAKNCTQVNTSPHGHRLLIHLTGTHARLSKWSESGSVIPFKQGDNLYSCPLWIGKPRNKVLFLFGTEALELNERVKADPKLEKKFFSWNLSKLLQMPKYTDKIFLQEEMTTIDLTTEVLMGLFLDYLKTCAETHFNVKFPNILFSVPLWFGSTVRQRLKDSAILAKFEDVQVFNESTVLTLMHISSCNQKVGTRRNFLVLCENSGNIDMVFYRSTAGLFLKMVSCSGNMYASAAFNSDELLEREEVQKEAKKLLLQTLLSDLTKRLSSDLDEMPIDVLLFVEDYEYEWKLIIQTVCGAPFVINTIVMYDLLGTFPISCEGTVLSASWTLPIVPFEDLQEICLKEFSPLGLFRSEMFDTVKLTEIYETSTNDRTVRTKCLFPTTSTTVYQENASKVKFEIGTLDISYVLYHKYLSIDVEFKMTKEGIVKLTSLIGFDLRGRPEEILNSSRDFEWKPVNLTREQIMEMTMNLEKIKTANITYQNELKHAKEHLRPLCIKLSKDLFQENFKKKPDVNTRLKIKTRLNSILNMFSTDSFDPLGELDFSRLKRWRAEIEGYANQYFKSESKNMKELLNLYMELSDKMVKMGGLDYNLARFGESVAKGFVKAISPKGNLGMAEVHEMNRCLTNLIWYDSLEQKKCIEMQSFMEQIFTDRNTRISAMSRILYQICDSIEYNGKSEQLAKLISCYKKTTSEIASTLLYR